jgi:hypothetical protein
MNIEKFIGVFEKRGEKNWIEKVGMISEEKEWKGLRVSVRWITFWGNKDAALARHYAATTTSALAFD